MIYNLIFIYMNLIMAGYAMLIIFIFYIIIFFLTEILTAVKSFHSGSWLHRGNIKGVWVRSGGFGAGWRGRRGFLWHKFSGAFFY